MSLPATYHCEYAWITEGSTSTDCGPALSAGAGLESAAPLEGAGPGDLLHGAEQVGETCSVGRSRSGRPAPWGGAGPHLRRGVLVEVTANGQIGRVTPDVACPPGAVRLAGVVLAGLANAHSHAFHRALRGRTHDRGGTFWTWREQMYGLAARLDPDSYLALATATYAEMVLAGVTCVGEFHYLHHGPAGRPYDDPNEMGEVLREAARRAGIRLTLLDTCYLAGGINEALGAEHLRFGDADAEAWATRVLRLRPDAATRIGVAAHSVRAVPPRAIEAVAATARALGDGTPLHAHVSEQLAENDACLAAYGITPTQLLHEHGALVSTTTAVHATHLGADDIALLGSSDAHACFCPTTERDLADGIGPARALHDAGVRLTLGSDQHAVTDMFEEARGLEMNERLASGQRGRFTPAELATALTSDGHASLGWPEAGRIEVGAPADLVAVRVDSVRTAGIDPAQVVLVATAVDIHTVVSAGRVVVRDGAHLLGDVGQVLTDAIHALHP